MNFKFKLICLFFVLFLLFFTASCGITGAATNNLDFNGDNGAETSEENNYNENEPKTDADAGEDSNLTENAGEVENNKPLENETGEEDIPYLSMPIYEINPKFDEYIKINPDIVGYIKIEETNIDFPVVYSGDNDYYLKHDIYGNETKYGAIFMDETNHGAVLAKNTIIHGHSFENDDSMFADLEKYKDKDFFSNNKTIIFNNLYSDMEWEVFAVYVTSEEDYYLLSSFASDKEYFDFVELIKSKAMFSSDYTPQKGDYMLTLHTCSYEFENAHTMVHARLIKKSDNFER